MLLFFLFFFVTELSNYEVRVGTDLADRRSVGSIYKIEKIFSHESYSTSTLQNDIAVLRTADPIQFSYEVQPICLPERDYAVDNQYDCEISGFGRIGAIGNEKSYMIFL